MLNDAPSEKRYPENTPNKISRFITGYTFISYTQNFWIRSKTCTKTKIKLRLSNEWHDAICCQYFSAYSDLIFCAAWIPWAVVRWAFVSEFRRIVNASLSENGCHIVLNNWLRWIIICRSLTLRYWDHYSLKNWSSSPKFRQFQFPKLLVTRFLHCERLQK